MIIFLALMFLKVFESLGDFYVSFFFSCWANSCPVSCQDSVNGLYTKCLQCLLRDSHLVSRNSLYLSCRSLKRNKLKSFCLYGWVKVRLSLLVLVNIYFWLLRLGPIFTLLCLYFIVCVLLWFAWWLGAFMAIRVIIWLGSFVPRMHDDIKAVRNVVE